MALSLRPTGDASMAAFTQREAAGVAHTLGQATKVAAVGRVAVGTLSGFCELGREQGLELQSAVHADPDELVASDDWQIALVLGPYKGEAAERCDRLGPRAARTGAADTLVRSRGSLVGLNANSYAIEAACVRMAPQATGEALVVGTGPTAHSALAALSELGRERIAVIGRSHAKALSLVDALGAGVAVESLDGLAPDLVVHATTVGEVDDEGDLQIPLEAVLTPGTAFLDFNARTSALQRLALDRGCVVMNGVLTQQLTNMMRLGLVAPPTMVSA